MVNGKRRAAVRMQGATLDQCLVNDARTGCDSDRNFAVSFGGAKSMKVFIGTLFAAALAASGAAAQESKLYVGGAVGAIVGGDSDLNVNLPGFSAGEASVDLQAGGLISGVVGFEATDRFDVEAEVLYAKTDLDTKAADQALGGSLGLDVKVTGLLANAKADLWSFSDGVQPYVGAGLGYGKVEYGVEGDSQDDSGLIWQLKAGFTVPVADAFTLDVGYRYLVLPEFELSDGAARLNIETDMHIMSIGGRYNF